MSKTSLDGSLLKGGKQAPALLPLLRGKANVYRAWITERWCRRIWFRLMDIERITPRKRVSLMYDILVEDNSSSLHFVAPMEYVMLRT